MIRRFGDPPVKGQNYILRPGAYGVLLRGDQILLTFQSDPAPEFQLPGGGIDPGESPIQALRRECMEETGWHIGPPKRLGAFRRFVFMPEYDQWAEKLCHVFLARPARAISKPIETGHHCIWVKPEMAIGMVENPGDRHVLAQLFGTA